MKEDVGYAVKGVSDHGHKELKPDEVYKVFKDQYINVDSPIKFIECHFQQIDGIRCELTIERDGVHKVYHGQGNGRLDAISNAIMRHFAVEFEIVNYDEHALQRGSNSQAVAYVAIQVSGRNDVTYGAGIHTDIIEASAYALISAVNKALQAEHLK